MLMAPTEGSIWLPKHRYLLPQEAVGYPSQPRKAGGYVTGPGALAEGWLATLGQCNGTRELFKQQVKPVLS